MKNADYMKICGFLKEKPVIMYERDLGDWIGAYLAPEGSDPSEDQFVGGEMICVNKATGEVKYQDDLPEEIFMRRG